MHSQLVLVIPLGLNHSYIEIGFIVSGTNVEEKALEKKSF